ncbi:class I SAM-dependent methyltransferase [Schaalia sp. 19OD2882]|uniref:class I SAM-dependent methyltransferase n=1 Tax=Schaalia sp. 19OD2882 TaxID=2794089 RepID=UPI001C1EC53F|nr:class I SAM-dependent methyltransferase [Schaalia sp. 19OD2882]QWW19506.1 class I SAM-dependent methyltransferase [Schaalia sp. 19OD2882]
MDNPFNCASSSYQRVRPTYPAEAVDHLCAVAGAALAGGGVFDAKDFVARGAGRVAVDLGAGTGKMTRELLARGWQVLAVEPADAMREQWLAHFEEAPHAQERPRSEASPQAPMPAKATVHTGTAEATGLPSSCAELVVAAQAWHWFDPELASAEAARLLHPGGTLGIVFNQMSVGVPWVHRLTRIMRSGDVHRADVPPQVRPQFTEPRLHLCAWEQHLSTDEVMELGRTRSSWLRQDAAGRAAMQENLRWYLHDHLGHAQGGEVVIPYTTLVWTSRRLDSR